MQNSGTALEVHLEAELQNPGRIRSSDGSKGAGAQSRSGVGDASAVAANGAARVGIVGVVEAVEALGTSFELQSLMQRDEFAEGRIHVGVVRPVELKRPGLAIRSSRVCGKGCTVQPGRDFSVLGARTADQVRPVIAYAGQGGVGAGRYRKGNAGLRGDDGC